MSGLKIWRTGEEVLSDIRIWGQTQGISALLITTKCVIGSCSDVSLWRDSALSNFTAAKFPISSRETRLGQMSEW